MFHAGRYLYGKELCYLGTVIVTADVHSGEYWSHISIHEMMVCAFTCEFVKQSPDKYHCCTEVIQCN